LVAPSIATAVTAGELGLPGDTGFGVVGCVKVGVAATCTDAIGALEVGSGARWR
jgi:hypothetical protein